MDIPDEDTDFIVYDEVPYLFIIKTMFFSINVFLFLKYIREISYRYYYDNGPTAQNVDLGYSVRWQLTEVDEEGMALCTV